MLWVLECGRTSSDDRADFWRRDRFGWEFKNHGNELDVAFKQLQLYIPVL